MTLLRFGSYFEYLKPGVKPATWCALSPLHHTALFLDVVIAKAKEGIIGLRWIPILPNPFRVPTVTAAVVDAFSLTAPTGSVVGMETRKSLPRSRICPLGTLLAVDPTSSGAGTRDLVLPQVLSMERTSKINDNYSPS